MDNEKSLDTLQAAKYNPRTISDPKLAALRESLAELGDMSGIVKNIASGNLVGGHQRVSIFRNDPGAKIVITKRMTDSPDKQGTVALGYIVLSDGATFAYREVMWELDVQDTNVYSGELLFNADGSPTMISLRERAANIAANNVHGDFVDEMLAGMTKQLQTQSKDLLDMTGLAQDKIDDLLKSFGNPDEPSEQSNADLPRCPTCHQVIHNQQA